MLVIGFPAAAFATNCFVLASAAGEECLVVDPGVGVLDRLAEVFRDFKLRPAAVLLTHGHLDHTYAVAPVCKGEVPLAVAAPPRDKDLDAYLHTDDMYRLKDPTELMDPMMLMMLEHEFGKKITWTPPSEVIEITDRQVLDIVGITLKVEHTPGHTEGSVIFTVDDVPDALPADAGIGSTIVAGDLLFAGGIGRTDLPGGNDDDMRASLRAILNQPDNALVLPGHGPATTIGHERASNPFLRGL